MIADLNSTLAGIWRPRQRVACLDWVQQHCWLSERFTARPGFYDVSFTPYLKPLHEWFGDEETRSTSTPKGAQIGYTTFLANAMAYAICQAPGPIIYITSTADNAKSWSEREWLPRIKDCKPLQALVPADKDDLRKQEQHFLPCTVKLVGAQSENNLASRPIRYFFADEVDKWPAGFLGQAEARTLSYSGTEKRIKGSTCSDEEGAIWLSWLNSTQHQWTVECPNCRATLILDFFKHVKWPAEHRDLLGKWDIERVRRATRGECDQCGAPWDQNTHRTMVSRGEAVATNPHASPRDKGLHIPSILSPTLSLGDLAAMWLQKKDQPGGREDFFNQYLGLPFSHDEWRITDEKLLAMRRDDYALRECPVVPEIVTFAADPGENQTHWSVEARSREGEAWLLDYGTVHTIEDLAPLFARLEYPIKGDTRRVRPSVGLIDSGWATERVYRLCARSGGRLSPTKGTSAEWGKAVEVGKLPAFPGVVLYSYIDFMAKTELYLDAIGRQSSPRLWWPANVGNDWLEGHARQELRSKQTPRGTMKFFKPLPADHFGDCSKLHRVAWWVLRLRYAA